MTSSPPSLSSGRPWATPGPGSCSDLGAAVTSPLSSGQAEMLVSRTPPTLYLALTYTAHTHSHPTEYPKPPGHQQTRTQVSPGSHAVLTCHPLCSKQSLQYLHPHPTRPAAGSAAPAAGQTSGGLKRAPSPPALCPRPAPVPSPHIHPCWTCGRRRTVPTEGGGSIFQ